MGYLVDFVALPVVQALGWALLHFLWQGTILALLLAGLLAQPALRSAQLRYGVCLVALLAMVGAPLLTGWVVYEPARIDVPLASVSTAESQAVEALVDAEGMGDGKKLSTLSVVSALPKAAANLRAYTPQVAPRSLSQDALLHWKIQRELLAPYVPWGVLLWFVGVFFLALYNMMGWVLVQRLKSQGVVPVPDAVDALLERLRAKLGIRRTVTCLQSARVLVPATIGWLKPVVLLPASTLLGLDRASWKRSSLTNWPTFAAMTTW
jgi:hypothetical protein